MRRSDREIKDFESIIQIIEKCDVCRIALNDEKFPYILPLNFGFEVIDEKIILYFHGANEGKKYDLIKKDNKASFEMDCSHKLVTNISNGTCKCTMQYESVIGKGKIEILKEEDKYHALSVLMKHYHHENFKLNENAIPNTTVFKLVVDEITGKRR